ncbi:MAG: hypothetical protein CMI52_03325 [Parcubacteria group bacterium]|nr:hypothetical protein [Parcubacteria group bacterium]
MSASQTHNTLQKVKQYIDDAFGSLFITDPNGMILYTNNAMAKKSGYQTPQIVGTKAGVLWGGRMSKEFYGELWKTVKYDKQPWAHQINNHYRSGIKQEYTYIAPVVDNTKQNPAYFLQLQRTDDTRAQAFADEFMEVCADTQPITENALMQLAQWLSPHQVLETSTKEAIKKAAYDQASLEDALYKIFVQPVNESLTDRHADHELVQAAQSDPIAFQFLYKKYLNIVRHYFVKRIGSTPQAFDLAQDVFMRAFLYLDRYKLANASYKTYVLRIAHNLLVNFYRRESLRSIKSANDSDIAAYTPNHARLFDNQLLWEFTQELPAIQRSVLVMKYKDDLSVREIATILGKSENAIKLHLSRARKALRLIFDNE